MKRFLSVRIAAEVHYSMNRAQRASRQNSVCPWPRPVGWPTYCRTSWDQWRAIHRADPERGWSPPRDPRSVLPERRPKVIVDAARRPRELSHLDAEEQRLFALQLAVVRAGALVERAKDSRRSAIMTNAGRKNLTSITHGIHDAILEYEAARVLWLAALEVHRAR
jgi:hypothetical protein